MVNMNGYNKISLSVMLLIFLHKSDSSFGEYITVHSVKLLEVYLVHQQCNTVWKFMVHVINLCLYSSHGLEIGLPVMIRFISRR